MPGIWEVTSPFVSLITNFMKGFWQFLLVLKLSYQSLLKQAGDGILCILTPTYNLNHQNS